MYITTPSFLHMGTEIKTCAYKAGTSLTKTAPIEVLFFSKSNDLIVTMSVTWLDIPYTTGANLVWSYTWLCTRDRIRRMSRETGERMQRKQKPMESLNSSRLDLWEKYLPTSGLWSPGVTEITR